jgi:hypothetical protein
MRIIQHSDGTWEVVNALGETLSVHITNEDAWRWLDRHATQAMSPAQKRSEYGFEKSLERQE